MAAPRFTPWPGSDQSYPGGEVEVQYRDGVIARGDSRDFDPICWQHDGSKFDIVAYRKVRS